MRRHAHSLLLATLLSVGAAARAEPSEAFAPVLQEQLYLDAMRSLAEGRAEEASAMLMRFLEQEPQHAGAWLDLALSQCALGHRDAAEKLFQQIEQRFAPPPGIREVIAQHRADGCLGPPPPHDLLALTVGRGYDNNVNQGASNAYFSFGSGANLTQGQLDPSFLPKADHYSVLALDYTGALGAGMLGFVQLRGRRLDQISEQNTNSLLVGVESPWSLGRWRGRTTGALGVLELNNTLYQRQGQLQWRASPPIAIAERLDWSLLAGVSHVAYPTRAHYDGNTLELGSALGYRSPALQGQFALGALKDHGQRERLGGDREGWYGNVLLAGNLAPSLIGELGWTRQVWRSDALYAAGLIDVLRRQDTTQWRASAQWRLLPRHSLQLEWRATRNRENISLLQYNSRSLQLTWRWDNF